MKTDKIGQGGSGTGWTPTKTPNKRALAVNRRLKFLTFLHSVTKEQGKVLPIRRLLSSFHLTPNLSYLYSQGIIEKKGRVYRWKGPEPSITMANEWCDHVMTYVRRLRDNHAPIKEEMAQSFNDMRTVDRRVGDYEAALIKIYNSTRSGYRKRSLTTLCQANGLPHAAGRLLVERGLIDRPRQGICKWIGPPPDNVLTLWLYGKLSEHHRSIYRSVLTKKIERTRLIDEMIGRLS
jgi:hypothetical protein